MLGSFQADRQRSGVTPRGLGLGWSCALSRTCGYPQGARVQDVHHQRARGVSEATHGVRGQVQSVPLRSQAAGQDRPRGGRRAPARGHQPRVAGRPDRGAHDAGRIILQRTRTTAWRQVLLCWSKRRTARPTARRGARRTSPTWHRRARASSWVPTTQLYCSDVCLWMSPPRPS